MLTRRSPHRWRCSPQLLLPPVLAALACVVPAQTWQVTITDLGVLPGGFGSSARAINDTGKIVGMSDSSTGRRTVEWVNGQMTILPVPGLSGDSIPTDVNDSGEIAGYYAVGSQRQGIYWNPSNTPFFLSGVPGGSGLSTTALAINNSGRILGKSTLAPTFDTRGVIWLGSSFQTDLGSCLPADINDAGVVVGLAAFSSTVVHAFRWQAGQFTNLGTWPGAGAATDAYAINNAGTIVGKSSNVASVWKNGVVTALPMPPGVSAFTAAIDINDAGDIIATGPVAFPIEVGVLWRNGQPINLGTLPGGTISRVFRINEAGEIVGEANDANGYFRAVKWTVTPASNGWTNLGQGLAGTGGVPVLVGSGSLSPAVSNQWSLANAKANAPALFVAGLSQASLPLFGGLLVPSPDVVFLQVTSSAGTATQNLTLVQAAPPGQQVTVQTWVIDPAGVAGWAASNAIRATAP